MRIKDTSFEEDSLNMTPLIDMVFLLLIFFLVATRVAEEEREIGMQLPNTAAVALSSPPQQLVINVREDGAAVVRGKAYESPALLQLLVEYHTAHPTREVLIRADERSLHRHFALVANLCKRAGISEAKIGYIFEQPAPTEVK